MRLPYTAVFSVAAVAAASSNSSNSTYINPVLPGWHSDPSCTYVADHMKLFCTVSTFSTFPSIPIYYSEDFLNWNLASNALTRLSQAPLLSYTTFQSQNDGLCAPAIRYRNGTFYVITSYVSIQPTFTARGLLFKSTDPFDEDSWGDPLRFEVGHIDPGLYWDDDGTAYVSYAGLSQQTLDLETGLRVGQYRIWNGSGGRLPEGPHIYKKDGYSCLLAGEGYAGNPILTNKNITEYFQTVGHADFFQDVNGKWWGACLAIKSSPEWVNYPMGREFVLFPVTWSEGEWPILEPERGRMIGWSLLSPAANSTFTVFPEDHPSSLQIIPSQSNLTGSLEVPSEIAFFGRRQTHTQFNLTLDLHFRPEAAGEEAGITLFLTQYQHIDLALIRSDTSKASTSGLPVRLSVQAVNETHYHLTAASVENASHVLDFGFAPATVLFGGTGSFTGTLLGMYAMINGGTGGMPAYFSWWRYTGEAQQIDNGGLIA
ncbi:glycosyl hydrolase [Elsinoe ampelina]|uniref:Glycosyl hydrolase n=1 Tax=Elsinoe ampelina TaxID=302913 RepID=A0A6A6GBB2_9PEZI|nr:glycosyl hydrolase [Elsinoe ampelina]